MCKFLLYKRVSPSYILNFNFDHILSCVLCSLSTSMMCLISLLCLTCELSRWTDNSMNTLQTHTRYFFRSIPYYFSLSLKYFTKTLQIHVTRLKLFSTLRFRKMSVQELIYAPVFLYSYIVQYFYSTFMSDFFKYLFMQPSYQCCW